MQLNILRAEAKKKKKKEREKEMGLIVQQRHQVVNGKMRLGAH